MIALTPLHHVELSQELAYLVQHPPNHDLILRTLAQKLSNQQPLIQSDLVLAGQDTLDAFPRTREYPVHFRKTYYPTSFHRPATLEYENLEKVAKVLNLPAPLGATRNSFRSCYIPGVPLDRLSPFGVEPPERNLEIADQADCLGLIGLWNLFERLNGQLDALHSSGIVHGDLYLHNVIVGQSPVGVLLIDFAQARHRDAESDEEWQELCAADRAELHRHALWLQCGLGAQPDSLGEASRKAAERLLGADAVRAQQRIAKHSML